jgi:hypothetical protein
MRSKFVNQTLVGMLIGYAKKETSIKPSKLVIGDQFVDAQRGNLGTKERREYL